MTFPYYPNHPCTAALFLLLPIHNNNKLPTPTRFHLTIRIKSPLQPNPLNSLRLRRLQLPFLKPLSQLAHHLPRLLKPIKQAIAAKNSLLFTVEKVHLESHLGRALPRRGDEDQAAVDRKRGEGRGCYGRDADSIEDHGGAFAVRQGQS